MVYLAKDVVNIVVSFGFVELFDTYFVQEVFSVIAVLVASEMKKLVTANQVVVAVDFDVIGVVAVVIKMFLFAIFLIEAKIDQLQNKQQLK